MERLTVKWTDKVYDTLDPVDILDNEYSKTNYNKLLTKLGEYEDFEEIFRAKMTDTACEFLEDKEEFGKWLDRNKWIAKKCDEYARAEEYKGGWIPCSERLPEESGTYIVNAIENSIIHVTFAKWMPRMKKWNLTGCRSYWKVNAWQPLPEPYKERD